MSLSLRQSTAHRARPHPQLGFSVSVSVSQRSSPSTPLANTIGSAARLTNNSMGATDDVKTDVARVAGVAHASEVDMEDTQVAAFIKRVKEFKERSEGEPCLYEDFGIEPGVWAKINSLQLSESEGYRLEYLAATKCIMVTWPSHPHESFHSTLKSFQALEQASEKAAEKDTSKLRFQCLYNADITFPDGSQCTPDFAFARCGPGATAYLIILECAFTQGKTSLDNKVELWRKYPGAELVIAVRLISEKEFRTPKDKLGVTTGAPMTWGYAGLDGGPQLGPIDLLGYTWASKVTKIEVQLYTEKEKSEAWDVTPIGENGSDEDRKNLAERQDLVTLAVSFVTKEAVGHVLFDELFPAKSQQGFDFGWPAFYQRLSRALRELAYSRYKVWLSTEFPDDPSAPLPPTAPTTPRTIDTVGLFKRKREDYGELGEQIKKQRQ
ncbi:hypothetical protein C8R44DRAFT_760277 [Mycena epipterygia]|nr:hypothetical protein C8R44DRAFT_760277 [Mycena epipterygia]